MRFPIGSKVKLADYTGDNQIDYYFGQVLEISGDLSHVEDGYVRSYHEYLYQYELTAPDGVVIICNADELEAA